MLWSLTTIGLAVYVGLCLSLLLFQSRLVYFPSRDLLVTPELRGLDYEDVYLESAPGVRLHGWFVPRRDAALTVLFCHGNAGNISHRLETIALLHELGLNVFIFDYAGYGASSGRPSEEQSYRDGLAAWRHLVEQRQLEAAQIVVFGRSLGAAVAIWLATEVQPAGLIIESAFTSVPELGASLYPLFPVRWLARIRYDNRSRIDELEVPLLVAHSPDDEIVPFAHGEALYEAAPEPKRLLRMSGGHNDGFVATGERYKKELASFLNTLVPR